MRYSMHVHVKLVKRKISRELGAGTGIQPSRSDVVYSMYVSNRMNLLFTHGALMSEIQPRKASMTGKTKNLRRFTALE